MVGRDIVIGHYGWRDWLVQRVTAVVMLCYTLFFLVVVSTLDLDYDRWKALWSLPVMRYATLLFVLSVVLHAWVGVRNICMDYVKDTGLRLVLYVVIVLALFVYGAWAVQILWSN